jgi:hypothetical protein
LTTATDSQLTGFRFFAQYAAAAYCNSANAPGQMISCANNTCPAVESNKAVTVVSVAYVHFQVGCPVKHQTNTANNSGSVTDIQGFVATDPTQNLIMVVFRGSKSAANWLTE